jgi:thiol:disulfide interchange protein DsbD
VANEIGPVPTSFVFEPNDAVKFIGKVNEPQPIQKYDENFEAMLDFFEGKVLFTQRLSVKQNTIITGTLTYMLCNDVMCLPPVDEKFKITITK